MQNNIDHDMTYFIKSKHSASHLVLANLLIIFNGYKKGE